MVKVKNIKFTEIPFESKDKNFQKCIEYIKLVDLDYKKYLPKNPKQHLAFELEGVTSDLANCIRRCLIDEVPVYSMNVLEEDIETDDRFILADYLRSKIEMIPFSQDITDKDAEHLSISLHVENKTDDTIFVYSRDFTIKYKTREKQSDPQNDKKNSDVDNSKYFTDTIPIIGLKSGKTLTIKNINIVSGIGRDNGGKFSLLSNIEYEILDVKPLGISKFNKTGESSLVSEPSHFGFGFTTYRNMNIKRVMPACCDVIIMRLTGIAETLKNIKESDTVYFSDLIELETKGDVKLFHLKGEYWTIANVIAKYGYLAFPDIPFICAAIDHPLTEESIVKIKHAESIKILRESVTTIISDIKNIAKAFR